jgi:hypothetical protein
MVGEVPSEIANATLPYLRRPQRYVAVGLGATAHARTRDIFGQLSSNPNGVNHYEKIPVDAMAKYLAQSKHLLAVKLSLDDSSETAEECPHQQFLSTFIEAIGQSNSVKGPCRVQASRLPVNL